MKKVVISVVVGGLAHLGTRTSAGTVMTKLRINAFINGSAQDSQGSPVR